MAEHFDAIVVDCDNEQNAALLFKSAHNSGSNQASLAVAVVEGQVGVAKAFRIGANLVLTKPINIEQSKGTLRVARGLLRKTEASKPATGTPATPPSPRSASNNTDARRPFPPRIAEPRPGPASLPEQPLPSPIPAVSSSLFEVEDEPALKPEPAEAALLESMPDLLGNKNLALDPTPISPASKEYPWQPISKPAAGPMATALLRAAEAAGRSDVDSSTASKAPASPASVSDAPASRYTSSMASGQAAAAAPAKTLRHSDEEAAALHARETPRVQAPTFSSLGGTSNEHAGGSKKTPLIAAAILVAALAASYVGWTKMHPASGTPVTQKLTASQPAVPVQVAVPSSTTPAQGTATTPTTTQPSGLANVLPTRQGFDATLFTTEAHPTAPKKTTSIVAPDTVVRNPLEATTPAPIVVRNNVSKPAPPPATEELAQPPALGSLGVASNTTDQALSGIMRTTPVNLPQPVQKLKVSQGVSQGLLVKSVPPEYPQQARQMHLQGAVQLLANIGKDGSITGVKVISGDSVLARAAMDAVKQWKYKPYYLNDKPVEIQTQITVNFKLP
jgi:protein TonB